ncbi:MAG: phospho-N-acetylmuramoyl-pentapeptide-transferase [Smithella sp.]
MNAIIIGIFISLITIILTKFLILFLNKQSVTLVQKQYGVKSHIYSKSSTPSMGGLVFIAVSILSIPIISGFSYEVWVELTGLWSLPIFVSLVGFVDDWIKYRFRSSEGFRSIYKLMVQIVIILPWSFWVAFSRGISIWPGLEIPPIFAVPLIVLFSVGVLNAVNVTDGLDGLAAGLCSISMASMLIWLTMDNEIYLASITGLCICLGFLWYNANPALIFMGDVGSHFLGGMLVSFCVYSDCFIAIIPVCFMFGLEILSVAIQLISIHKFKKKIFLMSPIHHHFEILGWKENHIVIRFIIVHILGIFTITSLLTFAFIY